MRVLHVAPSFARRDGGPSEVLRGLLPAQKRQGATITVVATDKGAGLGDSDFLTEHDVYLGRSKYLQSWSYSSDLPGLFRQTMKHADIIHIHSIHTFSSTIAMRMARALAVPYVVEPHGAFDDYHWNQGRMKKALYSGVVDRVGNRSMAGLIYSSDREKEQAQSKLPGARGFFMPLGVDEGLLASIRKSDDRDDFEVLFLGRVTEKKRLDLLIEALAQSVTAGRPFRLLVAGPVDPGLRYSPAQLADQLQVGGYVSFLGQVDALERRALLARANVFVLPSEDESFGVAVAEALASGCPTLVSRNVGLAAPVYLAGGLELVGLDSQEIASALRRLMDSSSFTKALGSQGREYAAEHFTWENAATHALHAYESVLER